MLYLMATLQTFIRTLHNRVADRDRGSLTIEQVLWAVAAIAFVAIVVAAIQGYVTDKSQLIK